MIMFELSDLLMCFCGIFGNRWWKNGLLKYGLCIWIICLVLMFIIVGIVCFSIGVSEGIGWLVIVVGRVVVVGMVSDVGDVVVWLFSCVVMVVVMNLLNVVVRVRVSRVGIGCMVWWFCNEGVGWESGYMVV